MPVDVKAEVLIARSREDVASYATNPANDPVWISGIVEAKMLTEPPVAEGTQVERVATFLGKRIQYVLEIVQWTPQSLMAMRSIKGPFPMEVSYEFEDSPDGGPEPVTLARIHVQGETRGFFKIAGPVLAQGVKRSITKDLKALKKIMESGSV